MQTILIFYHIHFQEHARKLDPGAQWSKTYERCTGIAALHVPARGPKVALIATAPC